MKKNWLQKIIAPQAIEVVHQPPSPEVMEKVLLSGDLSGLNPQARLSYYESVSRSLGLNPLTKPFEYITLNNKLVLYARKDCTEQLRRRYGISLQILSREITDGCIVVTAQAKMPNGRQDESIGSVALPTGSDAKANAMMKAECVPMDSEILTDTGWKLFDQVQIGESVLGYDCKTDKCTWTLLLEKRRFEDQPIVEFRTKGSQFTVRCTPDHKWAMRVYGARDISKLVRSQYKNRRPERRLIPLRDAKTSHRVILAAEEASNFAGLLSPMEAALIGWMVTDGTLKTEGNSRRIGICQSKEHNFAEIERVVVSSSGGDFGKTTGRAFTRTFPSGKTYDCKPQHWWYVGAKATRRLLEKCGYENRQSLLSIIPKLNYKARAAMLQAFMLAEGDGRSRFANTDPILIASFEMLCALNGIATGKTIHRVINGSSIMLKRLKKTRQVARSMCEVVGAGRSDVWCPTTAFGTWIMRQNGIVSITGNTKAKRRVTLSICGLGMFDESELESTNGFADTDDARRRVEAATQNRIGAIEDNSPITEENYADLVCHFGKAEGGMLGRKVSEIHPNILTWLNTHYGEGDGTRWGNPPSVQDARLKTAVEIALSKLNRE